LAVLDPLGYFLQWVPDLNKYSKFSVKYIQHFSTVQHIPCENKMLDKEEYLRDDKAMP
jgi:hypothetical protein